LNIPLDLDKIEEEMDEDFYYEELEIFEDFIDYKLLSAEVLSCSVVKKGFSDAYTYTLEITEKKLG
jgi:hypothetical protein